MSEKQQTKGIQPSSLGNFNTSHHAKDEPIKVPTLSVKPTTFGQSIPVLGFGMASKGDSFADLLKSPVKKRTRNESDEEDHEQEPTEFEEVAWKANEIKEIEPWDSMVTGEEDESNLHTARCKLYAWVKQGEVENWKERGSGQLKLNQTKQKPCVSRIVMRVDGVLRLILNVRIVSKMPCKLRDDKYVEIIACEHPPEFTKFLFKLGNAEQAKLLYDAILNAIPDSSKDDTKKAKLSDKKDSPAKKSDDQAIAEDVKAQKISPKETKKGQLNE